MLMTVTQYRELFAPGSRPDPRTVRRLIESGELPGRRIGKLWYVDPDATVEPDPRVSAAVAMILGAST